MNAQVSVVGKNPVITGTRSSLQAQMARYRSRISGTLEGDYSISLPFVNPASQGLEVLLTGTVNGALRFTSNREGALMGSLSVVINGHVPGDFWVEDLSFGGLAEKRIQVKGGMKGSVRITFEHTANLMPAFLIDLVGPKSEHVLVEISGKPDSRDYEVEEDADGNIHITIGKPDNV